MMLTISILLGLEVIRYLIIDKDINIFVGSALIISLWGQCLPLAIIVLIVCCLLFLVGFINEISK